jgi:hypothetical protein
MDVLGLKPARTMHAPSHAVDPRPKGIGVTLIDVGSTVLKGARVSPEGVTSFFQERRLDTPVAPQVEAFMAAIAEETGATMTRICSSANGGLGVGILCLTKRYSGAGAAHELEAVGANIRYIRELRALRQNGPAPHVDVLVVVGGVDAYANERAEKALLEVELRDLPHDKLVYAGHAAAAGAFRACHRKAEIVANPMRGRLAPEDRQLAERIRLTYLEDIESKRELRPLAKRSSRPIEPTPAVVSRAFGRLADRLGAPALLLDIGGATTDLHFTKELLDEERIAGSLAAYPAIARHVYTGYGVAASRQSTLQAFAGHRRCIDFLSALYGADARRVYLDLLEGVAPPRLLFEACLLLALDDASALAADDRPRLPDEAPPLLLNRLATLAVTGGAAKALDETAMRAAFAAIAGPEIPVMAAIDRNYCWWTLGLADDAELTPEVWRSAHV